MSIFTRKPKPQWCVLLYKAPTEAQPQVVHGPFATYNLALDYASSLSPGEFPSVRFTILPFERP
jgi:hypothetical protein